MGKKIVDKTYCMSSFLALRYVAEPDKIFAEGIEHQPLDRVPEEEMIGCATAEDIDKAIYNAMQNTDLSHAGLLLSGGIDSGILAAYMPKGANAYTVHNASQKNDLEVERAAKICEATGLNHVVVEVTWEDYDNIMDTLSLWDGCPVFGNEPQLYYLIQRAKEDGCDTIVLGDNADMAFGGMDGLLSKDWKFQEFIDRYTFVEPQKVLKDPVSLDYIYEDYRQGDGIDVIRFLNAIFSSSSGVAYYNALRALDMKWLDPYANLEMSIPLDLNRVRNGDSKYLLRDLYRMKYPGFPVPEKIPMARPMDLWMAEWTGPTREEFLPNCIDGMTGEQKYNIYSLERFLNALDRIENEK